MNRIILSIFAMLACSLSVLAATETVTVFEVANNIKQPITVNTGDGAFKVYGQKSIDGWTRVDDAYDADGNQIVVPLSHSETSGGVKYVTYYFKTLYNTSKSSSSSSVSSTKPKASKEERREKRERQARQRLEWFENNNFSLSQEVDLGLPSGNIWAGYNYGAESPLEAGEFVKWPETDFIADEWGDGWQIPSKADLDELYDCCEWECIKYKKVVGFRATGPNGNKIFFPIVGHYDDEGGRDKQVTFFWANELSQEATDNGVTLTIYDTKDLGNGSGVLYVWKEFYGNIRPVYKE